jgi:alpha-amylase
MAQSICFYFQVHQPYRLSRKNILRPSKSDDYFVGESPFSNAEVFDKVSKQCYLPMTKLLLQLTKKHPDHFACSFSFSGTFLEQCQEFPEVGTEVLENLKQLCRHKHVEVLGETHYHSLSFLYSKVEFIEQVMEHHRAIKKIFKQSPKIFRHTELIYNNELATCVKGLGYKGVVAEGWHTALPEDNPNYVRYATTIDLTPTDKELIAKNAFTDWTGVRKRTTKKLPVLTKNFKLSDDMAFRFGDSTWPDFPLNADKFIDWVAAAPGDTVNLFMDYETFGEHQWAETGIFDFFAALPAAAAKKNIEFLTPSQTIKSYKPVGVYNAPHWISWADEKRDISAWLDNDMQRSAFYELTKMSEALLPIRHSNNPKIKKIIKDFRRLQTSDHLYYMSTKYWKDGDVHTYFSPYATPYDAYINFMNVMNHLRERIEKKDSIKSPSSQKIHNSAKISTIPLN